MADAEDDIVPNETLPPTMQKVYDLDGNEHVVTHLNAHDLVTHLKWTRSRPIVKIVEVPAGSGVGKKAGKGNKPSLKDTATTTESRQDVEKMTREELLAEAAEYSINDAENFSDDDLRNAITVERN
jgi:hypothetical protein